MRDKKDHHPFVGCPNPSILRGCGSKINHHQDMDRLVWSWVHLPGFRFGHPFLTHSLAIWVSVIFGGPKNGACPFGFPLKHPLRVPYASPVWQKNKNIYRLFEKKKLASRSYQYQSTGTAPVSNVDNPRNQFTNFSCVDERGKPANSTQWSRIEICMGST